MREKTRNGGESIHHTPRLTWIDRMDRIKTDQD